MKRDVVAFMIPTFLELKHKNTNTPRLLGDPIAIEKLSEVFRDRYAEQME